MHQVDLALDSIGMLQRLPFIRDLHYEPAPEGQDPNHDGKLDIQTPKGCFHLLVEIKRSFLTRSDVNQLLAWVRQRGNGQPHRVIVLARHIPRPVAERLIDAKVNFADDVGNVHLALGDRYNWTLIGSPASETVLERRPITAAQLQVLFQFATCPESVNWPVRGLAAATGVSKSKVAQARKQLLLEGLLTHKGKAYQLGSKELLAERLTSGYAHALRPKLSLGRFRFVEKTAELFLLRLKNNPAPKVRYALTGGFAAAFLQHFYRGPEVSIFIEPGNRQTAQAIRLLPDREGPVTLLRAFGEAVFWEKHEGHILAPPWLVYAELLTIDDPRAHDAAREFRSQFLT